MVLLASLHLPCSFFLDFSKFKQFYAIDIGVLTSQGEKKRYWGPQLLIRFIHIFTKRLGVPAIVC